MARKFTQRKSFSELARLSYPELRKEYTTLRDIFQKRIGRLAKAGSVKAQPYITGGYAAFPTLKQLAKARGMQDQNILQAALLREVESLTNLLGQRTRTNAIEPRTLSLIGLRKQKKLQNTKILESLHEAGYENISQSTLKNFGNFMDRMREQYGRKLPNSEEMVEFFDSLKYNTKRRSTDFIVNLWQEFESNGYEPNYGNQSLFSS